jgi:hypothetical protein
VNLLAGTYYDPAVAVNKVATALLAMTALDTTNLRLTFTAPPSGRVFVRARGGCVHGATTFPQILVGCIENSPSAGTVRGRQAPNGGGFNGTALATTQLPVNVEYLVTGLTPGQAYTWDLAYGVEILLASTGWKYGGPNNTTTNDAFGGISFEIWDPSPIYTPAAGVPPTTTPHQKIDALPDAVWDEPIAGHLTAGSTGAALNGAGAAGDPWGTALPGAYAAGTAGDIIGNRLDAAVSSRSTYAGGDTAGTTTLLSRLTATRAGLMDNMDAAVSSRLATAGYTAPDNAGITTLTSRLTAGRATALDNLDAAISSRLASAGYTAPDNTGITTLLTRLSALRAAALDNIDTTVSSRLASAAYTTPDNANIATAAAAAAAAAVDAAAIRLKTDSLAFTVPGKVDSNLLYVNGTQVSGDGAGTPWGPA